MESQRQVTKKPEIILDKYLAIFEPARNFHVAPLYLQRFCQLEDESMYNFISSIKLQAQKCDYHDNSEIDIRLFEQLIAGIRHMDFQKELLEKPKKATLKQNDPCMIIWWRGFVLHSIIVTLQECHGVSNHRQIVRSHNRWIIKSCHYWPFVREISRSDSQDKGSILPQLLSCHGVIVKSELNTYPVAINNRIFNYLWVFHGFAWTTLCDNLQMNVEWYKCGVGFEQNCSSDGLVSNNQHAITGRQSLSVQLGTKSDAHIALE